MACLLSSGIRDSHHHPFIEVFRWKVAKLQVYSNVNRWESSLSDHWAEADAGKFTFRAIASSDLVHMRSLFSIQTFFRSFIGAREVLLSGLSNIFHFQHQVQRRQFASNRRRIDIGFRRSQKIAKVAFGVLNGFISLPNLMIIQLTARCRRWIKNKIFRARKWSRRHEDSGYQSKRLCNYQLPTKRLH